MHGLGGQHLRAGGFRVADHDVADARLAHVDILFQQPAQVAVGEDAGQLAVFVDHAGHAQSLAGHLQQRLAQRGRLADARDLVAGVHDVGDVEQQAATEAAGRVGAGEILDRETAALEQRDGERIAERERGGGRGGGCEVVRAGLLFDSGVEHGIGLAAEAGIRAAGQGDKFRAEALDDRQDGEDLGGLAGVGDGDDHVLGLDHAQIAVAGLAGVHEERRCTRRRQRGGDLAADVAALAHAADHHPPAAGEDQLAGAREAGAESRNEGGDGVGLQPEHFAGELLKRRRGGHAFAGIRGIG